MKEKHSKIKPPLAQPILVKFIHSEKTTKRKKSPICFDKTAVFFSIASKQVGDFFKNFVAFSEKLNFKKLGLRAS